MNGNNFESMIKKYADELIKMSREKTLPDLSEERPVQEPEESFIPEEESELLPFEEVKETDQEPSADDIPSIEDTVFNEEATENNFPKQEDRPTAYAAFSARVFTGNNAYPVENAKVLVVKDGRLYTFLTTDRDGVTKKVRLPSSPEANTLNPDSDKQYISYTGEVYATGFTPKKGLLIEAAGGSDVILDVQMTPISAEVK